MENLWQDLRFGFRMLCRRPGFALLSILTLMLGIGANTAIFSVVQTVFLQPLPYPGSGDLVLLHAVRHQGQPSAVSILDFRDIVEKTGVFESAAVVYPETYNITGKGEPERVPAAGVSADFFTVFKSNPVMGRGFRPEEEKPGTPEVVVVSERFWQRKFGDKKQLGNETIALDGVVYSIVGVASERFNFPAKTEVWRPLRFSPQELDPEQRGARYLRAIGRLKQGITIQEAKNQVETVGAQLSKQYSVSNEDTGASVTNLQEFLVRNFRKALMVLLGAVGFVLLIACVNVANLFLVHAAQRESEVAVRIALGARRIPLMRQFLVEGLLLTAISAIPAVFTAIWVTELLKKFGPADMPRLAEVSLNPTVLLFTFCLSAITGLLVGLVPALQTARVWNRVLKSAGQKGAPATSRMRGVLVASEIAIALMLLAGAGLLIRSFARLQQVDPGFDSSNVTTFALSLPDSRYPEQYQSSGFYAELLRNLASRPGVDSTAAVFGLPLTSGFSAGGSFERSDRPDDPNEPEAGVRVITPDYFQVMGIALRHGRAFQESDSAESTGVAIINEEAANRYWPGEDPLGKQLRLHVSLVNEKTKPRIIVGIVQSVRFQGLEANPEPEVFIPHTQHAVTSMMVVLRTKPNAAVNAAAIKSDVAALDPNLPIWDLKTMDEIIGASLSQRRFTMTLLACFAGVALLLAGVGIYGVLSFTVVQRTREIGLRMAIGASSRDVLRQFLKETFTIVVIGLSAGLLCAAGLSRLIASLLFQIPPADPATFASVTLILGGCGLIAGLVPALRASRVDPMSALRYE